MFRMCRGIILTIAGLILVGASEAPKPPTKSEKQQTEHTVEQAKPAAETDTTKPSKAVEPPEYYQPCGQRGSESNSDLCAQWSAAKAASKAAKWAWWQLWLSGLGVLGLCITLWFNFRALKLAEGASEETKGALAIAERNADAAAEHVIIARDSAKHQLRPYLYIERIEPIILLSETRNISIKLKNFGKTPAENVEISNSFRLCKSGQAVSKTTDLSKRSKSRDIPPGHTQTSLIPISYDDWTAAVELIKNGDVILVIDILYKYTGFDRVQYEPDPLVIVFGKEGPRQPTPDDNLVQE